MDDYKVSFKDLEPIVILAHNKEEALEKAVNQVIKSNNGTLTEREVLLRVKKIKKVYDPMLVLFIIAFILASIFTTYGGYRKWGEFDGLKGNIEFTVLLFIVFVGALLFFIYAPIVVFGLVGLMESLRQYVIEVVEDEYEKYCRWKKYSKYFKRFNVMLPGETITFKDMENDPVFNDAIEAYYIYKEPRSGYYYGRRSGYCRTKDGFHRSL